jgi:hypothetical protein
MSLISVAPEDSEDETVMVIHATNALYSAVMRSMHAIWNDD